MSEDKNEKNYIFIPYCLNTSKTHSIISIIEKYFSSTECVDINYPNKYIIEFKHKILMDNGIKEDCKNIYIESKKVPKNTKIKYAADCFMIFFDLENNDSLLELEKILKNISNFPDISEKKIYVINIFKDKNNIKEHLTEDNINDLFDKYELEDYDLSEIDLESEDEIVKVIDSITEDTIVNKKTNVRVNKIDDNKSRSHCLIN